MTREEASKILKDLIEQIQGTPAVHRQLWQAIETLYSLEADPAPLALPHPSDAQSN